MKQHDNPFADFGPKPWLWFALLVLAVFVSRQHIGYGIGIIGIGLLFWLFDVLSKQHYQDMSKRKGLWFTFVAILALLLLLISFWT